MSNDEPTFNGQTILITRPKSQAKPLTDLITRKGGHPVQLPTIEVTFQKPEANFLTGLSEYEWLIFTSANAVKGFLAGLENNDLPISVKGLPPIAVVGNKTRKVVENRIGQVAFLPEETNAKSLAATIPISKKAEVLWPCGNLSHSTISDELGKRGANVTPLRVYQTQIRTIPSDELKEALKAKPDAVIFTSPSGIQGLFDNLNQQDVSIGKVTYACIGETTARALENYGCIPHVISSDKTMEGLVTDLITFLNNSKANQEI